MNTSSSCQEAARRPKVGRIRRFVELALGFTVLAAAIALVVAALTACTSQQVHDGTPAVVGTVKTVLNAVGLGALSPLADSVGKLVMWVAGPPAVVGAGCYHKYRGLPLVGSRRRKLQEEDRDWDDALDHVEELARVGATEVAGKPVAERAQQALKIVGALRAKQPKRKSVPVPKA